MAKLKLIKEFIRDPSGIGTVFPSSAHLAKTITSSIGLEKARSVVEIGPGSGVFTRRILKIIPEDANFFLVELNLTMFRHLREKYPHVKIYNESAENLHGILRKENMNHAEVIVSGLPWSSFSGKLQRNIMKSLYGSLSHGGVFTTYAYLQGKFLPGGMNFRRLLYRYFRTVQTSEIVWRNFPPAFVYRCRK